MIALADEKFRSPEASLLFQPEEPHTLRGKLGQSPQNTNVVRAISVTSP